MVIYADILFLINLITDMLCLFVSGKVMNFKIRSLRLFLASAVGGVYGVLSELFFLYEPLCGILISVIMVLVCFEIRNILSFFKALLLMYCTGMLLGGIMGFLWRLVYQNKNTGIFKDGVDFKMFAVMLTFIFVFIMLSSGLFGMHIHKRSVACTIWSGTAEKKVRLLLDSGSLLKDPYTGKAVVIVKAEVLDELLGKDGIHRSFSVYDDETALDAKVHFVCAKTVGGQILLPVIGSVKICAGSKSGKRHELFAAVASDETGINDYMGNDGIIPYMLEGSI